MALADLLTAMSMNRLRVVAKQEGRDADPQAICSMGINLFRADDLT